jgi:putative mycofactocin binding protein MftB
MKVKMNSKYRLAAGVQVREEDFGLLFYQMNDPKLHFLASGKILGEDFFQGEMTLYAWMERDTGQPGMKVQTAEAIGKALKQLTRKGVIVEC